MLIGSWIYGAFLTTTPLRSLFLVLQARKQENKKTKHRAHLFRVPTFHAKNASERFFCQDRLGTMTGVKTDYWVFLNLRCCFGRGFLFGLQLLNAAATTFNLMVRLCTLDDTCLGK